MPSKNITLFYIIRFLETFVFTTGIWAFFFTSYHHFSFGQALFLITIWGIVSLFFEIPSWVWADRFGRKKVYIFWIFLLILNLLIWLIADSFLAFLLSWVIAGMWYAITSGNLEALIHDELEENKEEKKFQTIVGNSYSAIFIGRALASAVSGFLFVISPLLPVLLTLISYSTIFLLTFFLHEPRQILSTHIDIWSHLREAYSLLNRHRELLYTIIFIALLSGLGNVYYFTQQPYFYTIGLSIEWIGITFSLWALFSALWSFSFGKLAKKISENHILWIMLGCALTASILYLSFAIFWGLSALIFLSLMFGYTMTYGNAYIIKRIPKHQKSTMLSFFSLSITTGYSLLNIVLSVIDGIITLRQIYLFAFIVLLILTVLYVSVFLDIKSITKNLQNK